MRDRIRSRLRELGADAAARATEGAFISTIHGFCARALRTHALAAGIDPLFAVLDEPDAEALADAAFDEALEDLAQNAPGGVDLIAGYSPGMLRSGIIATHAELRSRGELEPALPPLPAAGRGRAPGRARRAARRGRGGRGRARAGRQSQYAGAAGARAAGSRASSGSAAPTTPRGRDRSTPSTCRAATARR